MIERIEAPAVLMKVTADVQKMCPIKDEVDNGTVTITYRTSDGGALELHALAAYLVTYSGQHLTHEEFVHRVAADVGGHVSSTWTTAGMTIECSTEGDPA